jgi:hypothetical protein
VAIFDRLLPRRLGGEILPLGVGILHAKVRAQAQQSYAPFNSENAWKYNLLSDPAVTLRIPRREIRFDVTGGDTPGGGARESLRDTCRQARHRLRRDGGGDGPRADGAARLLDALRPHSDII